MGRKQRLAVKIPKRTQSEFGLKRKNVDLCAIREQSCSPSQEDFSGLQLSFAKLYLHKGESHKAAEITAALLRNFAGYDRHIFDTLALHLELTTPRATLASIHQNPRPLVKSYALLVLVKLLQQKHKTADAETVFEQALYFFQTYLSFHTEVIGLFTEIQFHRGQIDALLTTLQQLQSPQYDPLQSLVALARKQISSNSSVLNNFQSLPLLTSAVPAQTSLSTEKS